MLHRARHAALALAAVWGLATAAEPPASAELRCDVTYAGTTHTLRATPVADPYGVASVDIGGRFWFKPVVVGSGTRVDYVKLYAYLDTRRQPVLVQMVRYLPPFPAATGPRGADLTGLQALYAGAVERELQYQCDLQGVQP